MGIGAMYGMLVALVIGLSWLGRVVNYFGFAQAALINPSIDAIVAVFVAFVGYTTRSRLALVVFLLYVVVGAAWVIAWLLHMQVSRPLYDVLGALFLGQLFAVGGVGGRLALRHWLASRRPRFRPYLIGG